MNAIRAAVWVAWATVSCREENAPPPPAAPPAASAAPTASAAPQPPHVGTWKATAELEAHRIDLDPKQGGIRQWRDGGSDAAGKTEITVDIDAEGNATGTITGAAGPLQARGRFADGALRMRVEAVQHDTRAFNGVLLGELEKDRITGSLRISSGDSLRVRVAKVSLAK